VLDSLRAAVRAGRAGEAHRLVVDGADSFEPWPEGGDAFFWAAGHGDAFFWAAGDGDAFFWAAGHGDVETLHELLFDRDYLGPPEAPRRAASLRAALDAARAWFDVDLADRPRVRVPYAEHSRTLRGPGRPGHARRRRRDGPAQRDARRTWPSRRHPGLVRTHVTNAAARRDTSSHAEDVAEPHLREASRSGSVDRGFVRRRASEKTRLPH
jgi:hypothetical protein